MLERNREWTFAKATGEAHWFVRSKGQILGLRSFGDYSFHSFLVKSTKWTFWDLTMKTNMTAPPGRNRILSIDEPIAKVGISGSTNSCSPCVPIHSAYSCPQLFVFRSPTSRCGTSSPVALPFPTGSPYLDIFSDRLRRIDQVMAILFHTGIKRTKNCLRCKSD